jgi:bis(5'-nucleosyl)-tetraphosphatase (symmetrical)
MTKPEHLYFIGDIQGCCDQLEALHALILKQDTQAHLFVVGDVVNRGPHSLATLRKLVGMGTRANTVLGNHDLSLLGVAYGVHQPKNDAYLRPILDAPDRDALLDWLRHRPLATLMHQHLILHAGVMPSWTLKQTLDYAHEVEQVLRGPRIIDFLRAMYGDTPSQWRPHLTGMERLRCIVNVLTRLRFCTPQDEMEFDSKQGPDQAPPGYSPWFNLPRLTQSTPIIFGHWSALGLHIAPNVIGLDTGCVWGGKLTAMRLSDRQLFQVDCS